MSVFDYLKIEEELASYWPVFLCLSCSDSAECKFEKVWGSKICATGQLASGAQAHIQAVGYL